MTTGTYSLLAGVPHPVIHFSLQVDILSWSLSVSRIIIILPRSQELLGKGESEPAVVLTWQPGFQFPPINLTKTSSANSIFSTEITPAPSVDFVISAVPTKVKRLSHSSTCKRNYICVTPNFRGLWTFPRPCQSISSSGGIWAWSDSPGAEGVGSAAGGLWQGTGSSFWAAKAG